MVLSATFANLQPSAETKATLSASSILQGVDAIEVKDLPQIWQQIQTKEVSVGHPDPDFLIALARLFFTKATDRSIGLAANFAT